MSYRHHLRAIDQESARLVTIFGPDGDIPIGAGCLISNRYVLTCYHVLRAALKSDRLPRNSQKFTVRLVGLSFVPKVKVTLLRFSDDIRGDDLALLRLPRSLKADVPDVEFVAPLRHGGKKYSVMGFPGGDAQGQHASGLLHPIDAEGLVQMDGDSQLFVRGGFSGAPVWCPELRGFVGIVSTAAQAERVAWCIPSAVICRFFNALRVRFRISASDRPIINDIEADDPNVTLFGGVSKLRGRSLTAFEIDRGRSDGERWLRIGVAFRTKSRPPSRGGIVTFITYPNFEKDNEDAYELFAEIDPHTGVAEQEFTSFGSFTVAAIADGGDTVLTLDLSNTRPRKYGRKKQKRAKLPNSWLRS